jgi:hypothetical protein
MIGKKQLKHLSTFGYSRVLTDAARILQSLEDSGREVWQYQCDNRKFYYRYYRIAVTILFLVTALLRTQNRKTVL